MVAPCTQVVCLGIFVDTINQSKSIPPNKLEIIEDTRTQCSSKSTCSKRGRQSILGFLLYVGKCIRYARILSLLRVNFVKNFVVTKNY